MASNRDDPKSGFGPDSGESISDVLASIRDLVRAETRSRNSGHPEERGDVLMLTEEMRVEGMPAPSGRFGEVMTEGMVSQVTLAPILDEAALRGVVNEVVREELRGELGDRISRNLRKLIRQELGQLLAERDGKS